MLSSFTIKPDFDETERLAYQFCRWDLGSLISNELLLALQSRIFRERPNSVFHSENIRKNNNGLIYFSALPWEAFAIRKHLGHVPPAEIIR
jgi:hypothetical protein